MLRYFVAMIFVILLEMEACFNRKINKLTVYGRYMEIGLKSNVPFLGESQKEMCERLKELRDFGNYGGVKSSTPEKALENLRGVLDG
jgi:hypothetical protein